MQKNKNKRDEAKASTIKEEQQPASETAAEDARDNPLAPFDTRLKKKPGEHLQSNEDPLNGVNE